MPYSFCVIICLIINNQWPSVLSLQQMAAVDGYDNQGMLRSELDINGKPVNGNTWWVYYILDLYYKDKV